MKRTVLDIVQDILSALDAEEVNSIDDTVEATQIAHIVKNCYLNMATTRNWAGQKRLIPFNHSATLDRPTHIKSPENLKELLIFKYDCSKDPTKTDYQEIRYKEPDSFLRLTSSRNENTLNVESVRDVGGVELFIVNNKPPTYWTTFDDTYIICDSYDRAVDDALKSSKTQAYAVMYPEFKVVDNFVPDIPVEAFAALFNEAKSVAFVEIKQVANQKAEQEAVRQRVWLSRNDWKLQGGVNYPNYGRRSQK